MFGLGLGLGLGFSFIHLSSPQNNLSMSGSWGAREAGQKPGERAENVATRRDILAYAVPPNWDSPPLPRLEEQVRKDLGELGTEVVTVVTRARQLANLNFSNLAVFNQVMEVNTVIR